MKRRSPTEPDLVVVTGAAGVLGRAAVASFTSAGAKVIALDRDAEALQQAFASSASVMTVAVDLLNPAATESALEPLLQQRAATVLCNIAGGFTMGPAVHETTDTGWRQLVDLNVATLINASRAVVPRMVEARRGKVVNVAAAGAVTGKAGMGAYCASKSGVARLTEAMALELREHGINVNAVAPSIIDTPANRSAMPDADPARWVSTADLVSVIRFLASAEAAAIHGAVIPVVGLS